MPQIPVVDVEASKRRLLTPQNLDELEINAASLDAILKTDAFKISVRGADGKVVQVSPDGISINESVFGVWSGPTAAERGWLAYFDIGAAMVEERADIIQPAADLLSARIYENRARVPRTFSDTVEFSVSNTLNWYLEGRAELTLQGTLSGTLTAQMQASIAASLAQMTNSTSASKSANTAIQHNHKDNIGTQNQSLTESSSSSTNQTTVTDTVTVTGTGTASGTATGMAGLMLGITGSVSGSVTTSYKSSSTVGGDLAAATLVETQATQRRQVRNFIYELPVSFAGYVALHYPVEVPVQENPPQATPPNTSQVIARNISRLNLNAPGRSYRPKGVAELVSTLAVEHIIFDNQSIPDQSLAFSTVRPRNL